MLSIAEFALSARFVRTKGTSCLAKPRDCHLNSVIAFLA